MKLLSTILHFFAYAEQSQQSQENVTSQCDTWQCQGWKSQLPLLRSFFGCSWPLKMWELHHFCRHWCRSLPAQCLWGLNYIAEGLLSHSEADRSVNGYWLCLTASVLGEDPVGLTETQVSKPGQSSAMPPAGLVENLFHRVESLFWQANLLCEEWLGVGLSCS